MRENLINVAKKDTDWSLGSDRYKVWLAQAELRKKFWLWLLEGDYYGRYYAELFGLVIHDLEAPRTVYRNKRHQPSIEVHAVRPALRRTKDGSVITDLVVEITQRRRGYFDPDEQKKMDQQGNPLPQNKHGDFIYRAGATILIDPATQAVRRVMRTQGTIGNDDELEQVRGFLLNKSDKSDNAFDGGLAKSFRLRKSFLRNEPFALLHRRLEE